MTEYQIQANTRRCSVSGRELKAGEKYFSVLMDEANVLTRRDFSVECWQGPPANAFSFWCGRIPTADSARHQPIDDEILFDCFRRLENEADPSRVNFRYVLGLLLMRRKKLRFVESRTEAEHEILILRCTRTREDYTVTNPRLSDEEMIAVRDEVFEVLGWQ